MKLWLGLLVLVIGVGLGLGLPRFAPQYLAPFLPKTLQGAREAVTGVVVRKQREADRLLLTISTPRGALLATFKQHLTEIDLLVEEQDSVTLGLAQYEPFVEDPSIQSVMKPQPQSLKEAGSQGDTVLQEQNVLEDLPNQETPATVGDPLTSGEAAF